MSERPGVRGKRWGRPTEGIDGAPKGALSHPSQPLRNLDWFEVSGIRGRFGEDGRYNFQVTARVGFRLEE